MGVEVHESRRHHQAVGVDHLGGRLVGPTDGHDPSAAHPHVGSSGRGSCPVHDGAAADQQVQHDDSGSLDGSGGNVPLIVTASRVTLSGPRSARSSSDG